MKPSRGTGSPDLPESAGTIASSIGSASVAPTPRRNVRLGNAFLVMNISSLEKPGSDLAYSLGKTDICHEDTKTRSRNRFLSTFEPSCLRGHWPLYSL